MDNWNDYLLSLGARHSPDDTLPPADFGRALNTADLAGGFVAVVGDVGLISVTGADAASFLHNQLTNDVEHLGTGEARLAGYCSPKGRLQATFLVWRDAESVYLQLPQELQAALQKRLSMFVMRAKAKLTDASEQFNVYGLAGTAIAGNGGDPTAAPGLRTALTDDGRDASLVSLYPSDGVPRALWIAPADSAAPTGDPLDAGLWQWSEVRSGIVTLTTPVIEAFVPQMLNYESVGGVNFKKGCYPGQEVVARSQFRGTLKRRTYLVEADGAVAVGDEVFAGGDAEQPVGTVAQVAPAPDGGWSALISMQVAALEAGGLHAGTVSGPALRVEPLPYPLLEDI